MSFLTCQPPDNCLCFNDDDPDQYPGHEALRAYALQFLNAPEAERASLLIGGSLLLPQNDVVFLRQFKDILRRQGWPVSKYGKKKSVRRCLVLEGDELTWGSCKPDGSQTSIKINAIVEISEEVMDGAPKGMDPTKCLCIIPEDLAGLKIYTDTVTDKIVLVHGFKLLSGIN